MKISATRALKAMDGEVIMASASQVLTLGVAISTILTSHRGQGVERPLDTMKAYVVAQKFYNEKEVDIDKADFDAVKRFIETDTVYGAIVTGQIMLILSDIKETDVKEEKKA